MYSSIHAPLVLGIHFFLFKDKCSTKLRKLQDKGQGQEPHPLGGLAQSGGLTWRIPTPAISKGQLLDYLLSASASLCLSFLIKQQRIFLDYFTLSWANIDQVPPASQEMYQSQITSVEALSSPQKGIHRPAHLLGADIC